MEIEEKMLAYLLQNVYPAAVDTYLDRVFENSEKESIASSVLLSNMIRSYLCVMSERGEVLPYEDVQGYFFHNGYPQECYRLLEEKCRKSKKSPANGQGKKAGISGGCFHKLLDALLPVITLWVDQALEDSSTDPQYSAVAASNALRCYIRLKKSRGGQVPYEDEVDFFQSRGYSEGQYDLFEARRKKESEYYCGPQF